MIEIEKLFSKNIKFIKDLHTSRGRKKNNHFIVEGYKTLQECSNSGLSPEYIVFDSSIKNGIDLEKVPKRFSATKTYVTNEFKKISTLTNGEGILGVFSKESVSNSNNDLNKFLSNKHKIIVLFDISDPGNFGTILRTALWFDIDGIILVGNSVDTLSPKVIRASMGAVFNIETISIDRFENYEKEFISFHKIGTFLNRSENFDKKEINKFTKKMILLGNEANGLDDNLFRFIDSNYIIGDNGKSKKIESLNLSIAAGIAIFDIFAN